MKASKKFIGVLCVLAIVAALSPAAFATNIGVPLNEALPVSSTEPIFQHGVINPNPPVPPLIMPRVQWIDNDEYTGTKYERSFTCYPDEGENLRIWIRNSSDYNLTVTISQVQPDGNTHSDTFPLAANDDFDETYTMMFGGGMTGRWTLKVESENNERMSIIAAVRQY